MDGYKVLCEHRKKKSWNFILCNRKSKCVKVSWDHKKSLECLWIRTSGVITEGEFRFGVCHWPPNQNGEADETFLWQLKELLGPQSLVAPITQALVRAAQPGRSSSSSGLWHILSLSLFWAPMMAVMGIIPVSVCSSALMSALSPKFLLWAWVSPSQQQWGLPLPAASGPCLLLQPQGHLHPAVVSQSSVPRQEQVMLLSAKGCLLLSPHFIPFRWPALFLRHCLHQARSGKHREPLWGAAGCFSQKQQTTPDSLERTTNL